MILTDKCLMLLKQMNLTEQSIDAWLDHYLSITASPDESSFIQWISVIAKNKTNVISITWKPSTSACNILIHDGYWPELINYQTGNFILYVMNADIKPVNLDAYFNQWVRNRLPKPELPLPLALWKPGQQLLFYCKGHGISLQKIEDLCPMYISAVKGRGEDANTINHDREFLIFLTRW